MNYLPLWVGWVLFHMTKEYFFFVDQKQDFLWGKKSHMRSRKFRASSSISSNHWKSNSPSSHDTRSSRGKLINHPARYNFRINSLMAARCSHLLAIHSWVYAEMGSNWSGNSSFWFLSSKWVIKLCSIGLTLSKIPWHSNTTRQKNSGMSTISIIILLFISMLYW